MYKPTAQPIDESKSNEEFQNILGHKIEEQHVKFSPMSCKAEAYKSLTQAQN
jgi:hypothetical protein